MQHPDFPLVESRLSLLVVNMEGGCDTCREATQVCDQSHTSYGVGKGLAND